MRKAFWYPQKLQLALRVARLQMKSLPAAERRRIPPQIQRHIPNVPGNHSDQLSLRPVQLVMQPAQHTAHRARLVVLHKLCRQTSLAIRPRIEHLGKPAAVVPISFRSYKLHVAQRRWDNLHLSDYKASRDT